MKKDLMLHFPYHSFSPLIDLLREAAIDPDVTAIKITGYRLAAQSKIMNALAILVFGAFIVIAGYEAGVTVTPELQWTVFASLTLVPAASCLVSAVPFLFYRLDR